VVPEARLVGTLACLAQGETPDDQFPMDQLEDGYPPLCFVPLETSEELWQLASSFNRCSLQRFYAAVLDWMYADDPIKIVEGFTELLGPDVQILFHPVVGIMPAVVTVIHPTFSICVCDGTRNFQTLATQAFQSVRRPTNFGSLGTLPLWYEASQHAHDFLTADGASPSTPIFFAGHSYGAATAMVLAARYRYANPLRTIRYITYGAPKPGNQRLIDLVTSCAGINLANHDDLVTMIPPDQLTLLPVMIALSAPSLAVWVDWLRPPNQVRQDVDGSLHVNELFSMDFSTLYAMAERVLNNQSLDVMNGHKVTEYFRRITQRCDTVSWPINSEILDLLDYELSDIVLGAGEELPDAGLVLGASFAGEVIDAGLVIGAGEELPDAGLVIGAELPDAGLVVGAAAELPDAGLVVGAAAELPDAGLVVGAAAELPDAGLVVGAED